MKTTLLIVFASICFLPGCQQNAAKAQPFTKIADAQVASWNQPANNFEELINPAGKTVYKTDLKRFADL
jgi:nitrous oxide reductase accessory protein NosL